MPEIAETRKRKWTREEVAEKMEAFEQAYQQTPSERQLAQELGIPRSTLQHWLKRKERIDAEPEVVAFFESAVGVAFLHRLVLAAHLVMTLLGPCGIRLVCLFLELSGLDQFVAACYGAQRKVAVVMEEAVVTFGKEEKERLAAGMATKQVTVCEDETFHPQICLVAIEPVSNFILLEQYADDRKAETWTKALGAATEGLPIEIVQSTSDEGRGLLRHVKKDLGVHHSPDLFHVQQELVRGTSVALASRKRRAEEAVAETTKQVSRHREEQPTDPDGEGSHKSAPGVEGQLEQAQKTLETVTAHQERVKKAIQGVSVAYHPFDLETGAARSAEKVSTALEQLFAEVETVAAEANLPQRCLKKIQKAKGVVVEMVATVAFFWLIAKAKVEASSLTPEVEQAVYDHLIPAIYLSLVSEKTRDPEQRYTLLIKSKKLLAPLLSRNGPLADLETTEKVTIETVARECAQLFQRSSSCVEGRNGQLALRHHSLHRISDRKLTALTTVHNYFTKRRNGTTAAERFFGSKPRDLFEWLLEQVDLPGRPAQQRPQPQRKAYLIQAAA